MLGYFEILEIATRSAKIARHSDVFVGVPYILGEIGNILENYMSEWQICWD